MPLAFAVPVVPPVAADEAQHLFCCAPGTAAGRVPRWHCRKYPIDREGRVVATFLAQTAPEDPTLKGSDREAAVTEPSP